MAQVRPPFWGGWHCRCRLMVPPQGSEQEDQGDQEVHSPSTVRRRGRAGGGTVRLGWRPRRPLPCSLQAPLARPGLQPLTWAGGCEAGLGLVLGAWAVLQHRETGWGAAAAPALYPRPTRLAAGAPRAPGAPGSTTLFIMGGPCPRCQVTVRVPVAHLRREQGQGSFRFGRHNCSASCTTHSPPSPAGNRCRGLRGRSILGRKPQSCWGLLELVAPLGRRGEKAQLAGE